MLLGDYNRTTNNYDDLQDMLLEDEYEDYTMVEDPIQQYITIMETLKKRSTMAINEDYENWKDNDFHREVAKLLLIDQGDYNTQHIFFDDNADE